MSGGAFRTVWRSALAARADVTTAEGREAFDAALRASLRKIECPHLRAHVAEMCRAERKRLIAAADHLVAQRAMLRRAERVLQDMLDPEAAA